MTQDADHEKASIEYLGNRPAGKDPDDPYEDVNLEILPDWWCHSVEEFRQHELRPYRPPRFTDNELVPPMVEQLETDFDIDIRLLGLNVTEGDDWNIFVGDKEVASIGRHRDPAGYTVFELSRQEFEEVIREFIGE